MYNWKNLTEEQKNEIIKTRKIQKLPWHSPLHIDSGDKNYMLTASCYNHEHRIGFTYNRMQEFEASLLKVINEYSSEIFAWCILPNHYHVLIRTSKIKELIANIGKLHGRISFLWNKEENIKGRQNWHGIAETVMKSKGHFYASLNYINNNPVKHCYVTKWADWNYSSAEIYLNKVGREKVLKIWNHYPLFDYGKNWDDYE